MGTEQRTLDISAEDSGAPEDQEIKGQYGVESAQFRLKKRHLFRKKAKIHDMGGKMMKSKRLIIIGLIISILLIFPGCGTEKNAETIEENF